MNKTTELTRTQLNEKLNAFLAEYPTNAKSWANATDEPRELCYNIRQAYNEQVLDTVEGDPGHIEGMNYRAFKTPAEWNKMSHHFATKYAALLPELHLQNVMVRMSILPEGYEIW